MAGASLFLINNSCDLIRNDEKKLAALNSLTPGDIVTVRYLVADEGYTRGSGNRVKIVGISSSSGKIVSPEELLSVDGKSKWRWYISGAILTVIGSVLFVIRAKTGK